MRSQNAQKWQNSTSLSIDIWKFHDTACARPARLPYLKNTFLILAASCLIGWKVWAEILLNVLAVHASVCGRWWNRISRALQCWPSRSGLVAVITVHWAGAWRQRGWYMLHRLIWWFVQSIKLPAALLWLVTSRSLRIIADRGRQCSRRP